MKARVAVVIPCFNDGTYLPAAVDSVRESEPVEIVVVDDGSTDAATLEVFRRLESEGVRVVHHAENRGLSAARTTGRSATSAPYVFALDSDDRLMPGVLAAMVDRLEAHPEAVVCFGDYDTFGTVNFRRQVPMSLDPFRIAYHNEIGAMALFRRSMLEAVNAWEPVVPGARGRDDFYEDWHLWMTLAERGAVGVHLGRGRPVYRYQVQDGRLTSAGRLRRREQYRRLQERHPALFADLRRHRRRSDLAPIQKLLYPVVFGNRPRLAIEYRLKSALEHRRGRVG
jgi:glycosyltransferase involved in cell wall biosynthesis